MARSECRHRPQFLSVEDAMKSGDAKTRSIRRGAAAAARDGAMLIKRGIQKHDQELVVLGSFLCRFAASMVQK